MSENFLTDLNICYSTIYCPELFIKFSQVSPCIHTHQSADLLDPTIPMLRAASTDICGVFVNSDISSDVYCRGCLWPLHQSKVESVNSW